MSEETPDSRVARASARWLAPVCLFLILSLALYLRLSHLNSVYWFSGDQGRQALVVRDIFEKGRLPLSGPSHSYGGAMYGPIYYYLYVPAYIAMRGDARFGGVTHAILGGLTVCMAYALTLRCGGSKTAALVAALLLGVSPSMVWMDRTMWNPNLLPFFSLLGFWYAGELVEGRRRSIAVLVAVFAILTQIHIGGWPVVAGLLIGTILILGRRRLTKPVAQRSLSESSSSSTPSTPSILSTKSTLADQPTDPRRATTFPRIVDWALVVAILACSVALWLHAARDEPEDLSRPMKFLAGARTLPEATNKIAESARTVAWFASLQVFRNVPASGPLLFAFWATTAVLFAWRLRRGTQAARIQALLLGLTLLFFVGAYSCVTVEHQPYTFSAMQPILAVWLALSWLGGPGTRTGSVKESDGSDRSGRSDLSYKNARPDPVRFRRIATPVLFSAPLLLIAFLGAKYLVVSYLPGRSWVGEHYKASRRIADRIASDAGGRPFALALIEGEGNDRAYLRYLLLQEHGVDCANPESLETIQASRPVKRLYLVVRQELPAETAARLRSAVEAHRFRIKPVGTSSVVCIDFSDSSDISEFISSLRRIPGLFPS